MSTSSRPGGAGGEPSGRPGRYQRNVGGLVGAMIILVLSVLVFIGFRGLVRDNPESAPVEPVAYEQVVGPAAGQTGWQVAAPRTLPQGWVARSVRFEGPPGAFWHLGLLTGSDQYVGVEQAVARTRSLVDSYVGEEASRAGTLTLPLPGGGQAEWQRWTDVDDDVAVTTRIDDQVLLVVTTAGEQELRTAVDSLTLQG